MIKKIAWDAFKNTGNIDDYMRFKQIENFENNINNIKDIQNITNLNLQDMPKDKYFE